MTVEELLQKLVELCQEGKAQCEVVVENAYRDGVEDVCYQDNEGVVLISF